LLDLVLVEEVAVVVEMLMQRDRQVVDQVMVLGLLLVDES
jgi:hypothetical protein